MSKVSTSSSAAEGRCVCDTLYRSPILGRLSDNGADRSADGLAGYERRTLGMVGAIMLAVYISFAMNLYLLPPRANRLASLRSRRPLKPGRSCRKAYPLSPISCARNVPHMSAIAAARPVGVRTVRLTSSGPAAADRPCETVSCLYAQSMGWRSTELRGLTPRLHTEPLMYSHTR